MIDLTDHCNFFLIDGKVKVVALCLVISIDNIGNTPFFGVEFLAELDTLGSVGALLLCKGAKDSKNKLAITHRGHICRQELRLDSQSL